MKYIHKHISTAASIIATYSGAMPLSNYLKQFFAANKKYGGKDRKYIAHFCFLYYRLVGACPKLPIEETIKIALFLSSDDTSDYLDIFPNEWRPKLNEILNNKLVFIVSVYPSINIHLCFPLLNELSEGIDATSFSISHLQQPDLFLRIRPKQKEKVLEKLAAAGINYQLVNDTCVALPNNSKIEEVLQLDREVVVQDFSSQRIGEFLTLVTISNISNQATTVWDCCAASGGKSILAADILGNLRLTVSDIRGSIIQNLKNRLAKAGVPIHNVFVKDLAISNQSLATSNSYQLIICDAPCSGSGTWGRTPEQLYFFKQSDIGKYVHLQQKIVTSTIPQLDRNGYFMYITCSVFKKENEKMVDFILQQYSGLSLIKQALLIGYNQKADSMFAALFQLKD
ncbi:Fmu (Sun) domain-containing protein [Parasediminibacterium paludis]|uniref:Fmu (Sun) domain-containing protein n=1 Tax=Parasediminibacterium paludis TaxID=908966 RepID=A0ABV8PQZ7_9BACT